MAAFSPAYFIVAHTGLVDVNLGVCKLVGCCSLLCFDKLLATLGMNKYVKAKAKDWRAERLRMCMRGRKLCCEGES